MTPLGSLIDGLRSWGPRERSTSEMASLLSSACESWSLGRPLLSRPNGYTRTRAYGDVHFEVLLLNWDAGAASAVHDHGGQHCWMLVLNGSLRVADYVRLDAGDRPGIARIEARDSRLLEAGGLDLRSGPFDLHRVSATPGQPALSLHVYARPLQRFLVYDGEAETCAPAQGLCDADLTTAAQNRMAP